LYAGHLSLPENNLVYTIIIVNGQAAQHPLQSDSGSTARNSSRVLP
jgi:hypothetical protein